MDTTQVRSWFGKLLAAAALAAVLLPGVSGADEPVLDPKHPRDPNDIVYGGQGVTDHSAIAAVCSLIIPGVGQIINHNESKKVVTHAVIGLLYFVGFVQPLGFVFGLFHVWSAWDAFIVRKGGYFNGTVEATGAWLDVSCGGHDPGMA